ncbi:MAG: GatB/YqeY domain-containing protein [Chloroflexota bacterium]
MPSLIERLSDDLKDAMRGGQTTRRDEIRGLLSMLKAEQGNKLTRMLSGEGLILHGDNAELSADQQARIDQLRSSTRLTADEEQAVLSQRVKQHRQSIDGFRHGHRYDLVELEETQLAVAEAYLPQQLDLAEVEATIQAALTETGAQGPRDQGKMMGLLSARLRGRADLKAVASRVTALLAQRA